MIVLLTLILLTLLFGPDFILAGILVLLKLVGFLFCLGMLAFAIVSLA